MIDLQQKNEWQFVDEETGLILPWLTKSCLDEIATWDLSDKNVWEYGLGSSTLWWSKKCEFISGVDNNIDWVMAVEYALNENLDYGDYVNAALTHKDNKESYVNSIYFNDPYDIIIIDGIYREECVPVALDCLREGGCLIYDNYMQPSVEVQSEETQQLLLSLPHKIYKQEGHPDWKTLVVHI